MAAPIKFIGKPKTKQYVIEGETHTVGNLLQIHLAKDRNRVQAVGYINPHPSEESILLKITPASGHNPDDILRDTVKGLTWDLNWLKASFQTEVSNAIEYKSKSSKMQV
jgi:DNA-directed RNA polymerase subunit L